MGTVALLETKLFWYTFSPEENPRSNFVADRSAPPPPRSATMSELASEPAVTFNGIALVRLMSLIDVDDACKFAAMIAALRCTPNVTVCVAELLCCAETSTALIARMRKTPTMLIGDLITADGNWLA